MTMSDEVVRALTDFYGRFSAGDVEVFAQGLAAGDEALVIGTDGGQWEEGHDTWASAYGSQMEQLPGLTIKAGDRLRGYAEGDLGWAADQPSFVLPDGTELPVRLSAVFHREEGMWKIVHLHVSFGVPDAKLEQLLPVLLD